MTHERKPLAPKPARAVTSEHGPARACRRLPAPSVAVLYATLLAVCGVCATTGCTPLAGPAALRRPSGIPSVQPSADQRAGRVQTESELRPSPSAPAGDREASLPAGRAVSEARSDNTEVITRGQSPDPSWQSYTREPAQYEQYEGRSLQPPTPYQPRVTPAPSQGIPSYDQGFPSGAQQGPVWQGPQAAAPPAGNGMAPGLAPGTQFGQQPPLGNLPPGQMLGPNEPFVQPDRYVDIDASADETQTGRFMFGVGVNSDAGVVGSIVIDEQNFDWQRVPYSWEDVRSGKAFRGDGQRFRIEAAPGTEVQRYLFDFTEPYFMDTAVSFGLSGYFYDRRFRDYDEERLGGRVSVGYQFTPDLSGSVSLRAEQIEISNPRVAPPPELAEVLGESALYSVRTKMAHDTRDNTFLATEGHYIELGFEQAFGDFVFPRMTLDARRYFTLVERPDGSGRQVLSLIGRIGISGDDTPLFEEFFAGGSSTLRGFEFRGASPVNGGVVVGGDFQLLGSVEYLFPITADDMLRGITFVDFGTVERDVELDADTFRVAPGFGLRITIPALGPAPIALDFAFPINKAPTDDTQVFSFFVGFGR